jgi:hypothetical protein
MDESNTDVTCLALSPREQREIGIVNPKTQKNESGPLDLGSHFPSAVGSGEAAQGLSAGIGVRGSDVSH